MHERENFSNILLEALKETEKLKLLIKIITEEVISGTRRSRYKGSSQEFSEYRAYYPGDEPRYIDWKVFGRTDRLFVKTFEEETKARVTIWVDTSRSMFLNNSRIKFAYALIVATVLSIIASRIGELVKLTMFPKNPVKTINSNPGEAIEFFEEHLKTQLEGKIPWKQLTHHLIKSTEGKRSLFVLISDFSPSYRQLAQGELENIYRVFPLLRQYQRGSKLVAVQVLDKEELFIPQEDILLVEPEDAKKLKIDSSRITTIHQKFMERIKGLQKWAVRHSSIFITTTTDEHPGTVVRRIISTI